MENSICIISLVFLLSCGADKKGTQQSEINNPKIIQNEDYELIIPPKGSNTVLVLMGGNAEGIKREFDIVDISISNQITLMLLNINDLLLDESDKGKLSNTIIMGLKENGIESNNFYMGGLSVGGNMALLLGDYLIRTNSEIIPKGIFVVDSPIDLLGVYGYAKKTVTKDLDAQSIAEAEELIELFETQFGIGDTSLVNFEKYSPCVLKTNSFDNLKGLKNTKLRFYTEPDSIWWMNNLKTDFENTNAYHIKLLSDQLKGQFGEDNVEYISTVNKGYRADGTRHPHSWSIVEKNDLVKWMLYSASMNNPR